MKDIYNLLWILLPLFSLLSMPVFIFILWRTGKQAATGFILLMVLESIFAAFFSVHTFGGTFGPGMVIFCLSFVIFIVSLTLFIVYHARFYRQFYEDELRKKVYMRGGLLILLLQFSPVIGYFCIRVGCSLQTRHNARPYITSVNSYYQVTGHYPDRLDDLNSPSDLSIILPGCTWLDGDKNNRFEIVQCSSGETLLTAHTVDGSSILRYCFGEEIWTSISILDDVCSDLP